VSQCQVPSPIRNLWNRVQYRQASGSVKNTKAATYVAAFVFRSILIRYEAHGQTQ